MTVTRLADDMLVLQAGPAATLNVHILGDVIVDAGVRWSRRAIARQLSSTSVTAHALTHAHADHIGATPWLAEEHGLPVWVGAGDADRLASGEVDTHESAVARWVMRHALRPRPVEPSRRLVEGDVVGGFTVLEVPGHSPGALAFYREHDRVLLVGDAAMNVGRSTRRPKVITIPAFLHHDRRQAARSLTRLTGLRPSLVAFGHGHPVRGPDAFEEAVATAAT